MLWRTTTTTATDVTTSISGSSDFLSEDIQVLANVRITVYWEPHDTGANQAPSVSISPEPQYVGEDDTAAYTVTFCYRTFESNEK